MINVQYSMFSEEPYVYMKFHPPLAHTFPVQEHQVNAGKRTAVHDDVSGG